MTLTSCDLALAAIAAPEPESRLTSSSTFAPLVMACSACCCWVALSPSAFWISTSTPAASNACCRNGRSTVSQRTDDLESGSSTATLPASACSWLPPEAAPSPSSSSPQPANASMPLAAITAMSHAPLRIRGFPPPRGWDVRSSWRLHTRQGADGELAFGLREYERDRTEDLGAIPEHAGPHPGVLGGCGQGAAGQRLADAVEQQVTGRGQPPADHDQL